jgi:hypothetical protein
MWARVMNANMSSIMASVVPVWCERAGLHVDCFVYTGFEDLATALPADPDLVFISSFSRSAQLAYAMSELYRRQGAVTVLGGPHARCYPDDAMRYFDYVCGFTSEATIREITAECAPHRPIGRHITAAQQPSELPSLAERWKFIAPTLEKAPLIKIVPMLGSLGCPYTCSFCIDAEVDYKALPFEQLRDDLRFLLTKFRRPKVGWHDPNFGVRFDALLDAIEEAVPPGSIEHIAESSLALLSEQRVKRLQRNGFKAILPGIESWYELGEKSRTGRDTGEEKVKRIADHVNMLLRYIPYVQANFILGLDSDAGAEPFELTKKFLDRCPAAFPAYSLLTAFGEAAPVNLTLQKDGRVRPFPFHMLDNNHAMNVQPKNYSWPEFYDRLVDLTEYSFSWKSIGRRLAAQGPGRAGGMNVIRGMSSEGWGRLKYHSMIRGLLDTDRSVRAFADGDTTEIPAFYRDRIRRKLGPFWELLPAGGLDHDPNAYLRKQQAQVFQVQRQIAH